ncbi:MAG: malate dehydrogenase [Anaerolineales bacterium]|nr:malate dehydrogenase [Anaerolineales bacterium]
MRPKVSIIGAGNTGSATAVWLAAKDLCDIVLLDAVDGLAQGAALDLQEAIPILEQSTSVHGTSDYADTRDSDVVIITAGKPRKPGMTRDELAQTNAAVIKETVAAAVGHSPEAILIILTNPVDAMTYLAYRSSGLPKQRVIGQAGILDSSRFQILIARELGVSVESVHAFMLGGHGDTMVPMVRHSNVCGVPLSDLIPAERLEALVDRARNRGTELINLLKTRSAAYAPGAALTAMVGSILNNTHRVFPCSAYCEGEFGLDDIYFGVPVQIGRTGVERIVELSLNAEERATLEASAARIRKIVSGLASNGP